MEHKPKRKHFQKKLFIFVLLLKDIHLKIKERKGDIRLRISRLIENEAVCYRNESR